jgi:hypothetical protein
MSRECKSTGELKSPCKTDHKENTIINNTDELVKTAITRNAHSFLFKNFADTLCYCCTKYQSLNADNFMPCNIINNS